MNIEIPVIPLGIVTLLAFVGPYAVALLNGLFKFVTEPWQRKLVSVLVAAVLAVAVILLYLGSGGTLPPGGWATVILWSVVILAASYALVTKPSASALEARVEARHSL